MVKPFNGGRPRQSAPVVNIDVTKLDAAACVCGNPIFIGAFICKIVPALMSPNGQPAIGNLPVYACNKCGRAYLPEDLVKMPMTPEQAAQIRAEHDGE